MRRPKSKLVLFLAATMFVLPMLYSAKPAQADRVRPLRLKTWSIRTGGIWRRETRTRVIARWYRYYRWVSVQSLWLKRRAEVVWITKQSLTDFLCRSCCVYYWNRPPQFGGPRILKIYRSFRTTSIRRFRVCYRIWWAGHLNAVLRDHNLGQLVRPEVAAAVQPPLDQLDPRLRRRFCVDIQRAEIVLPLMPLDPQDVEVHTFHPDGQQDTQLPPMRRDQFLQQAQLTMMPDMQEMQQQGIDPFNTFQIATTDNAMDADVPNPNPFGGPLRLEEDQTQLGQVPADLQDSNCPVAEISQGVYVKWIANEAGESMVPGHDNLLDPQVLGDQTQVGLIGNDQQLPQDGLPIGAEVELPLDLPLQLQCALVDDNGTILGAAPGQLVLGGPAAGPDFDGPQGQPDGLADLDQNTALGGPDPMNPTDVLILEPTPPGQQIPDEPLEPFHTGLPPNDMVIVQGGEPDQAQLNNTNALLQQQNFAPHFPPFNFCINRINVKRWWGCDRRVVKDTWIHCWTWVIRHHVHLTKYMHRIWLWRAAVATFSYDRWCYVFGQPPTHAGFDVTSIRFIRVCYRVFCPRPNVIRIRVDQIILVVDMGDGSLGLVTTIRDAALLPPPRVLAGLDPDPLQPGIGSSGQDGVLVEDIADPQEMAAEAQTMAAGAPGVFERELTVDAGQMQNTTLLKNTDMATALRNNQLQLYCMVLDNNGGIQTDTFPQAPGLGAMRTALTPAPPEFNPPNLGGGQGVLPPADPTDLGMELAIPNDTDCNDDDITDIFDFANCFVPDWLQGLTTIP
jgi:hypothetical protein